MVFVPSLPVLLRSNASAALEHTSLPSGYLLPDLLSVCPFPVRYNEHGDEVEPQSARWLDLGCPELDPTMRAALYTVKNGELCGHCYLKCDAHRLRIISDFQIYLFHLDDVSDGLLERDANALGEIVMNALQYPHEYHPLQPPINGIVEEESSASQLARE